jgi:CRISPR-associated protein Cmr1
LRFWYRAVDPAYKDREERIFGSTDKGQASFLLTVEVKNPEIQPPGEHWQQAELGYLGFGAVLYDKKAGCQVTQRPYVKPGFQFTVMCQFRPRVSPEDKDRVLRAFKAFTLFGGLGSRSRRGFGSLQVVRLGEWDGPPVNVEELKRRCRDVAPPEDSGSSLPGHTSFSEKSEVKIISTAPNDQNWQDVMKWIGRRMINYRSCYNDRNDRFRPDHDLFYKVIAGNDPGATPERHVFGLPHNYFSSKAGNKSMSVEGRDAEGCSIDRRGSPLFIRAHQLKAGNHVALFAFLPSRFLPEKSKLVMASGNHVFSHIPATHWAVITKFLAGLNP